MGRRSRSALIGHQEKDIYSRETDLLEVWQQALPIPSFIAERLPPIVIRLGTAIEDHAIQLCRATDNFSLRNRDIAAAQVLTCCISRVPIILGANSSTRQTRDGDEIFILVAMRLLKPCLRNQL